MKKRMLALALALLLTGCQAEQSGSEPPTLSVEEPSAASQLPQEEPAPSRDGASSQEEAIAGESGVLIAYFSWAQNAVMADGADAVTSPSVSDPGNVQQLAGWIQEETGGDLFSIQVTDPYPRDWDACLERANQEWGDNARPQLTEPQVEGLEQYGTVFLGYPNWWYGVPTALLSFLEQNDLSGKDVYLFCSHGTGGLARSVEQITEAAPDAIISDNIFDCYEEEAPTSQEDIQAWVAERGFSQQHTATEGEESSMTQIAVSWDGGQAVYELNHSPAAQSLLAQLPLTTQVEDYSTNEKIFYPEEGLDTSDTPLARAGAGTLAYYEPWGDVVFFYGEYNENPGLFELGQVVSGGDLISQMSGTITIETMESQKGGNHDA